MSSLLSINSVSSRHMNSLSRIGKSDTLGALLKRRREDLEDTSREIQQLDIAVSLGLSQAYISRLENGGLEATVRKWRGERIYQLLQAYRFSPEEIQVIAERYGLALQLPNALLPLEVDVVSFPVYTARSLGVGRFVPVEKHSSVAILKEVLKKYGVGPDAVMTIVVDCDCLISQKLRYSIRSVAFGDYISLDIKRTPEAGDVVACWDKREGVMVLKYQEEGAGGEVLFLYDFEGSTLPVSLNDADLSHRGVVFFRGGGF